MKTALLTALVIVAVSLKTGNAYPSGAPVGACSHMTPNHYGNSPNQTPPPFTVTVSGNMYSPGSTVTVTISSPCGKTFRGFMLEARRADSDQDTTAALGTFSTPAASQTRDCGSGGQAVTHINKNDKTSMAFVWTAPSPAVGHIVFRATIVETFSSFWTGVHSPAVLQMNLQTAVKPGSNVYPSANSCPSTTTKPPQTTATTRATTASTKRASTATTKRATTATTKRALTENTTSAQGMRLMWDPDCGVSKGCATDCNGGSCSFLVKWTPSPNSDDMRFELTAVLNHGQNQWMAIGLSDDLRMGNSSVAECVSYNGQISVYSSYNYPFIKYNSRLPEEHYGVTKVSASLNNGVFSCTFDRKIDDAYLTDFYGLTENRYLLFASGRTELFSDEKKPHTDRPPTTVMKVDFFSLMDYTVGYVASAGHMHEMGFKPMLVIILAWIVKTVF